MSQNFGGHETAFQLTSVPGVDMLDSRAQTGGKGGVAMLAEPSAGFDEKDPEIGAKSGDAATRLAQELESLEEQNMRQLLEELLTKINSKYEKHPLFDRRPSEEQHSRYSASSPEIEPLTTGEIIEHTAATSSAVLGFDSGNGLLFDTVATQISGEVQFSAIPGKELTTEPESGQDREPENIADAKNALDFTPLPHLQKEQLIPDLPTFRREIEQNEDGNDTGGRDLISEDIASASPSRVFLINLALHAAEVANGQRKVASLGSYVSNRVARELQQQNSLTREKYAMMRRIDKTQTPKLYGRVWVQQLTQRTVDAVVTVRQGRRIFPVTMQLLRRNSGSWQATRLYIM
ncbi:MAG: Rv3235 family protein [Microbacteriaceae bacterium]|nr:Rv3235 family protein [Microbacteriaceae bacterium]